MSLLADILKEIPLSAVLREKISTAEAEITILKDENAFLKDKLREAKTQIGNLEKRIENLTHNPDLDETDVLLLKHLALIEHYEQRTAERIALPSELKLLVVKHRLHRLVGSGYLMAHSIGGPDYYVQQKSLDHLIKNNLLA